MKIEKIIEWILAVVAIALFVRLVMVSFSLIFNFSGMPIGQSIGVGTFLEQLSDVSLGKILIQLIITIVIVVLIVVSRQSKRKIK